MGHEAILDERDDLRRPLAGSVAFHVGLVAFFLLLSWWEGRHRESWGDPNSLGGGTFAVNTVKQIPIASRAGRVNPVANDTESALPQPKQEAARKARAPEPDLDAIEIRGRNRRERRTSASTQRYRSVKEEAPNQLYSRTGQALVTPMMGQTGSGGVGVGTGSPFGNRFGYYVDLLRQRVGEKWRTSDIDANIKTAPPVIVTFTILRDGSVRDVRIGQRSGNGALDYSAQRAILDASPLPPLPSGYERNEATIEFWFQLRR